MALITCWKCEKKYSDTIDRCIHCGAPKEMPAPPEPSLSIEDVRIEKVKVKKPEYTDFYDHSEEMRNRLEGEFWAHDKKAAKWRRVEIETKRTWGVVLALFYFFSVGFFLAKIFYSEDYEKFFMCSILCSLVAVALAVIISLGLIVATIYVKYSINSLLYMKKLQKWLFEEKNIRFIPRFKSAKERTRFEKIDLKYMDF